MTFYTIVFSIHHSLNNYTWQELQSNPATEFHLNESLYSNVMHDGRGNGQKQLYM